MIDNFPPSVVASIFANVNEGVPCPNNPPVVQSHFVHAVILRPAAIAVVVVVVVRISDCDASLHFVHAVILRPAAITVVVVRISDCDASLHDFDRSRSMRRNKISIMFSYVRNGHVRV